MKRKMPPVSSSPRFRVTSAEKATSLLDGVQLSDKVVMPWVGYGTYRLGKEKAFEPTLNAIRKGYRCIDTAFVYAGETTERQVGQAIEAATKEIKNFDRSNLFLITKHWRNYHGYYETLRCLDLSLKRLKVDHVDLYLMHWPGPAYNSLAKRKDVLETQGLWAYAKISEAEMSRVRAETWRAMESALEQGKCRSIGVSNFTVRHLKTLKKTAKVWPPAVNQVECHPLYQNNELRAYCEKEGIVIQAYAALGGQDASKKKWKELLDGQKLLTCPEVLSVAEQLQVTPAQVLLRYALQRNCAVTPKTVSAGRMEENAALFHFALSKTHMESLDQLQAEGDEGRLCWRTDPLRLLDFE